jgi:HEAT repeat protein
MKNASRSALGKAFWLILPAIILAIPLIAALLFRQQRYVGHPVNAWARDLTAVDAATRQKAAAALGDFGPVASSALPALIRALDDTDEAVKVEAAIAIDKIAPNTPQTLQTLKSILLHGQPTFQRARVASHLGMLGPSAPAALPSLIYALTDPDHGVRSNAAHSLGMIRTRAPAATQALCRALQDNSPWVRAEAAWALGEIRELANLILLTKVLRDSEDFVAIAAIKSIGTFGAQAHVAIPALKLAMKHQTLRPFIVAQLYRIGPSPDTQPELLVLELRNPNRDDRLIATIFLGRIGAKARVYSAEIRRLLHDGDHEIRYAAGRTLDRINE